MGEGRSGVRGKRFEEKKKKILKRESINERVTLTLARFPKVEAAVSRPMSGGVGGGRWAVGSGQPARGGGHLFVDGGGKKAVIPRRCARAPGPEVALLLGIASLPG